MDEPKKTSYSQYYKSLNREKFNNREKQISSANVPEKIPEKPKPEYSPKYTSTIKQYYPAGKKEKVNFPIKKEYEEGHIHEKAKLSPEKYNQIITSTKQTNIKIERERNRSLRNIFYIAGIMAIGLVLWFTIKNQRNYIYILMIIIILLFIAFYLFHKEYEKAIYNANKKIILIIVYVLLLLNIIFGIKVYSVEWAFCGFLAAAVVLYDSRIDCRFLVLPALMLLAYIPFLLIGKQNSLAEKFAVYVYYFLVVGVGLQLAEYMGKKENLLNFESVMGEVIKRINWITAISIVGLICFGVIIANRFYNLEIWKWTSVYIFAVCLVFYGISTIKKD